MQLKSYWNKVSYWILRDHIPVTMSLLVYSILVYFIAAFGLGAHILEMMAFGSWSLLARPWSLVTYALVPVGSIFCFLGSLLWLWVAGGSLERSWGTGKYSGYMAANTTVSVLGLLIGGILTGQNILAVGLWLPLAGMTMAFAVKNPDDSMLFCFVIPLKLKYLAVISAASVMVSFAYAGFVVAVFALAGCAFSLWYATGAKLTFGQGTVNRHANVIRVFPREGTAKKLNPLKFIAERRERKRLKDFLEKSGIDEK